MDHERGYIQRFSEFENREHIDQTVKDKKNAVIVTYQWID